MRLSIVFAKRNIKEIIRDPLSFIFAIILPSFLLIIFQQFKIPNDAYLIKNFTPGIIVFGFSFITMFTATLISKDKTSSLLFRLSAGPMKPFEYILGYFLSAIPLAIIQVILFTFIAIPLGLALNLNTLYLILLSIPVSFLYVFLGIIIGSITTDKSAPGASSVIVQLVCFTSGMYFSSDMLGKGFNFICDILPFKSSVNIIKFALNNTINNLALDVLTFIFYTLLAIVFSTLLFYKNLRKDVK